jgi:hypothetical protein
MKNIILIAALLILSTSCASHTKRAVASDAKSEIQFNVKELYTKNRAHYLDMEIYPINSEVLKSSAEIVFKNDSIFKVELVTNTDASYSLKVVVPFTFNPADTKVRVFGESGKYYDLPLL